MLLRSGRITRSYKANEASERTMEPDVSSTEAQWGSPQGSSYDVVDSHNTSYSPVLESGYSNRPQTQHYGLSPYDPAYPQEPTEWGQPPLIEGSYGTQPYPSIPQDESPTNRPPTYVQQGEGAVRPQIPTSDHYRPTPPASHSIEQFEGDPEVPWSHVYPVNPQSHRESITSVFNNEFPELEKYPGDHPHQDKMKVELDDMQKTKRSKGKRKERSPPMQQGKYKKHRRGDGDRHDGRGASMAS